MLKTGTGVPPMEQALAQAEAAAERGEVPVGAVIVDFGDRNRAVGGRKPHRGAGRSDRPRGGSGDSRGLRRAGRTEASGL